jgi:predicted metal-dependent hydrolase
MGIPYRRLSIRGQKNRWGSCSRNGTVSLNWKLMFLPEPIIDYVIVHELAHIREMNHSAKFWDIVQNFCPDYKRYRRYLKTYPNGKF